MEMTFEDSVVEKLVITCHREEQSCVRGAWPDGGHLGQGPGVR